MNECRSNFLEEKLCVLCGSNSYEVVYRYPSGYYDHSFYETCSWDGRQLIPLRIVKCSNCGLVYTRPSFKANSLDKVYPEDIVQDAHFDSALKSSKYSTIINLVQTYFPGRQVLIDIGTRYGALPYIARKCDYRAYGLEYNSASVDLARARGIDYVVQGTVNNLGNLLEAKNLTSAEIVVLDDVVEHLVDPLKDLKLVSAVQQSGDGLIMRQMNWNSLGRHIFGANWYYVQPAAHMFYFDTRRMKLMLNQAGYEVVRILTPSLFKNIIMTALTLVRRGLLSLAKNIFNNEASHSSTEKRLYLSERRKSWNDMFTVVARRS